MLIFLFPFILQDNEAYARADSQPETLSLEEGSRRSEDMPIDEVGSSDPFDFAV